jgi:two-component system C4-dicarboxylate transport response regulator DctD
MSKIPTASFIQTARVLLIDDDSDVRYALVQTLMLQGAEVSAYDQAEAALAVLDAEFDGVVVTDLRMPGMDGVQLFAQVRAIDTDIPVILITGHGDVDTAVQAMHDGAYDFLAKPFARDRLWHSIQRAVEKRQLILENRRLQQVAIWASKRDTLIGEAPAIRRLRQTMTQIADADVDVLIQGETGAGKDVVAHALHQTSRRRDRPFVAINCGALPEAIIESELFGHEAGAFTGAQKRRIGRIEHANGGTLFLDEIESMPLPLQVKLLRVLESRQVTPLGTNDVRTLDLRVVAATKEDLSLDSARAFFREDLYYRLNVVTLRIPPLRERGDDIAALFARFVDQAAKRFQRSAPSFDQATLAYLHHHSWPGNVRELVHFAERFVLGIPGLNEPASLPDGTVWPAPNDLPLASTAPAAAPATLANEDNAATLPQRVEQFESEVIRATLAAARGDVKQTLARLGIPRKTFYDKLHRHGIERSDFVK